MNAIFLMTESAPRRVTDMAEVRYLVIKRNGEWKITLGRAKMGCYLDRVHAIDAAIDMADQDGRDGRDSQVLVRGEDRQLLIEWTYGRDPYPDYPKLLPLPKERRPSRAYRPHGHEPAEVFGSAASIPDAIPLSRSRLPA